MHLMVYGEYVQSPQVRLAALLAAQTPGIDSYYFVNSGAEAIEGCIKLARRYTSRKKIFQESGFDSGITTCGKSINVMSPSQYKILYAERSP